MEKKQIDLENITLEELKEDYKILALENDALRQLAESHKGENERLSAKNAKLEKDLESVNGSKELKEAYEHLSAENEKLKDTLKTKEQTLNYTWENSDRLTKRIDELKGTLRSIIKLAESELK